MYEEMYAPLPDAKAYAERIGLEWPLTPDLDTLDRIILAHQCMVPFENLQCYDQGQEPSLAIETLFEKIVAQRRGGFCFELNALLLSFLKALDMTPGGSPAVLSVGGITRRPCCTGPSWSVWKKQCITATWDTAVPSRRGRFRGR